MLSAFNFLVWEAGSSVRIGMKVSDHCSIIALVSLYPSCIHPSMKKLLFWKKMLCSGNMILCRLARCCDASIFSLAAKFYLEPHDVVRSGITRIKHSFWFYFSKLV